MRFIVGTLAVVSFLLSDFAGAEIWTSQMYEANMRAAGVNTRSCEDIVSNCINADERRRRDRYNVLSIACEAEQKSLGCSRLTTLDPELGPRMRSCTPVSMCKEHPVFYLKGCFWNAPGAWGSDILDTVVSAVKAAPEASRSAWRETQQCLGNEDCRNTSAQLMLYLANPHLLMTKAIDFSVRNPELTKQILTDASQKVYTASKAWIEKQGLKLQCFSEEEQAAMVCYAALEIFVPGAAAKAATKIPRAIKLARTGKLATQEAAVVARTGRAMGRGKLLENFLHKKFTTPEQNGRWIALADRTTYPTASRKFFDVENSALKQLNDITNDKDLVTALTNKHKDIFFKHLEELKAKYPDVQFSPYSDYKSVRIALEKPSGGKPWPPQLEKDFADLFARTNREFSEFVQTENLLSFPANSSSWFRAGFGETADQATAAARYARSAGEGNRMMSYADPIMQRNLNNSLKALEDYRVDLQRDFGRTRLMTSFDDSFQRIPTADVFNITRKAPNNDALIRAIKDKYDITLTQQQALRLRDYTSMVDEFSPGIRATTRNVVSLADAKYGGMSIDFAGLGASNLRSTAGGLARTTNIDEAILRSRQAERSVTAQLEQQRRAITESVEEALKARNVRAEVRFSGDDMVIKPDAPLDEQTRMNILTAVARHSPQGSPVRMSYVGSSVTNAQQRALLATQGESIEKALRAQLSQVDIPDVTFMVEMNQVGGNVVSRLQMSRVLPVETRRQVQEAFSQAVRQVNEGIRVQN